MTNSQRVLLLLLAASLLAGAATGGRLYYQLVYIWILVFVGSWVWSRLSLQGLQLQRTIRTARAQVGQIFEERFELQNQGRFPKIWVEVIDESSLPGSEGSRVVTMVAGRQGRSFLARTRLLRRGVFTLGPTVLASGDPFGIFPARRSVPSEETLLVYPLMVDIDSFPAPPGLLPGGEALRRRTHQITPNAAGVRDYVHGDPLSRIHWLSSARRDQLTVKEFELDPLADVWIILDASRFAQFSLPAEEEDPRVVDVLQRDYRPKLPPSTEEYSISAAASLARSILRRGRAVGLVAAGQHTTLLPPDRGGRQLGKILEELALLQARGNVPLRALVETQSKHMARGSTVIIITSAIFRETATMADYLQRRGLRPVVVLLDPATFGGGISAKEMALQMKTMGVPVRRVECGQDLAAALSVEA
jgi:uncharacterized protein (DUF58 family)